MSQYQSNKFYKNNDQPNPQNIGSNYQQNFDNFNRAFTPNQEIKFNGNDPKSGFTNNNFKNPNTFIHNDIYDNVLNEWIREYSMIIDSKDRNYEVYPNPFEFTVEIAPLPQRKGYTRPTPFIDCNIKNIKYIRLDTAMLPLYYRSIDGKVDINRTLTDDLYNLIHIKELEGENKYSTNDVLTRSFAPLYYDRDAGKGKTHFLALPKTEAVYEFPPDQLGELKKLTISITDPYGNVYKPNNLSKKFECERYCQCSDETLELYEERNERIKELKRIERTDEQEKEYKQLIKLNMEINCCIHNLSHPWNPIYQNHLHFKIGVVIPRPNKITFN